MPRAEWTVFSNAQPRYVVDAIGVEGNKYTRVKQSDTSRVSEIPTAWVPGIFKGGEDRLDPIIP